MRELVLLTAPKRFIGQTRRPWVPLDVDRFISELKNKSITVREYEYHQAANTAELQNSTIFYSFSQVENLRAYLRDLVFSLQQRGNKVLPSYELLLCHENKGYQEHYKKLLGITSPWAYYLSRKEEITSYNISYPVVLKSLEGSNAKGVALVKNQQELLHKINLWEGKLGWYDRWDLFRRNYLRKAKQFPGYPQYSNKLDQEQYREHIEPRLRFVLQEFIPGLDSDYRVIVLGDRFYVSRRMTKQGDWRASGTKLFTYDPKPNPDLLDYASSLYYKVSSPSLAMDVGISDNGLHLFEFQALHFGVTPIVLGPGYFIKHRGDWQFQEGSGSYEVELAYAIDHYLVNRM